MPRATLPRSERLHGQKAIERLFSSPNRRSLAAYPLRVIYSVSEEDSLGQPQRMLVSVPKRLLRHAVDRNRVKRQIRETYRLNKHLLSGSAPPSPPSRTIRLAFLWQADTILATREVERRMRNLLQRLNEQL